MIIKLRNRKKHNLFNRNKRINLVFILLVLFVCNAYANTDLYLSSSSNIILQNTVLGVVVDSEGTPIAGVNVVIEGTNTGAATDFDGNYQINASRGDVLEFSYVGMLTVRVTVEDSNTINVTMQ
jgi:hypothetical protein